MTLTRRWLSALLILLLLAVPAAAQRRAPPPLPKPLAPAMWVVEDKDSSVTIFGTVHTLPRGVDWFAPHIVTALDGADRLVLEALPPDGPGGMLAVVMRLARLPAARPMADRVPASYQERLDVALKRLRAPPMEWYDSWYVALTLANLQAATNGLDPRIGVEAVLAERARIHNRPIEGLETIEEQLIYFDALSDADQAQLLMATLDDLDGAKVRLDAMIASWLAGDTDALAAVMNRDFERSPMLMRMLVNDRNARWAAWIADALKKPGKTFLAVGAGHLAGQGSLQDELKRHGLTASRVLPAPLPPVKRRRR